MGLDIRVLTEDLQELEITEDIEEDSEPLAVNMEGREDDPAAHHFASSEGDGEPQTLEFDEDFDDIGLEDLDFDDAGFTVADSEELDGLGLDE